MIPYKNSLVTGQRSGPIYRYLLIDFSADSSSFSPPAALVFTPLTSGFSLLGGDRPDTIAVIALSFLLLLPLLILGLRHRSARQNPVAS